MTIRTALVNSLIYPLSAARKPTLSSGAHVESHESLASAGLCRLRLFHACRGTRLHARENRMGAAGFAGSMEFLLRPAND